MRTLDAAALAVSVLGALLGSVRWLRVAQREHYLSGCCSIFASRWWRGSPANAAAFAAACAAVVIGIFHPPTAGIAGVAAIVGPFGLGLRGRTSKLAWTSRLRRVAAVTLVLGVGVIVGASIGGGLGAGTEVAAVVALGAPGIVDLAMALLFPIEERLAIGYVRKAERTLRRIAPVVVGITGSYGKTSTKGYVAHLLGSRF